MATQVVDYVERIVGDMTFDFVVDSFSDDATDTTILVCDTFHARKGLTISDGVINYTILTVDHDTKTIVMSGLPDVANVTLTLQDPFYFHGTPYATNNRLSLFKSNATKTPFVYLLEIVREQVDDDPESSIERTPDLRIFFLDDANIQDWDTDDHYDFVIDGMRNLADLFIQQLKADGKTGKLTTHEVISHANFGQFTDLRGHTQKILNENLSGVELNIQVPLLKDFSCEVNC